jgi:hypothetical protein
MGEALKNENKLAPAAGDPPEAASGHIAQRDVIGALVGSFGGPAAESIDDVIYR